LRPLRFKPDSDAWYALTYPKGKQDFVQGVRVRDAPGDAGVTVIDVSHSGEQGVGLRVGQIKRESADEIAFEVLEPQNPLPDGLVTLIRKDLMLDDVLLADYMGAFFGYGSWNAHYWFVGIEEAGGNSIDEVRRRLEAWHERGRRQIEDLADFHHAACLMPDWFSKNAWIQTTWKPLILAALTAEGSVTDDKTILEHQRTTLGREDGETTIIEFLPLPSPSGNNWKYASWSKLPEMRIRNTYERAVQKQRVDYVAKVIREYSPPVVVFYGRRRMWSVRFQLSASDLLKTDVGWCGDSLLIATDHTSAWSNDALERFEAIGQYIRLNVRDKRSQV
jgi:hypothetical protein